MRQLDDSIGETFQDCHWFKAGVCIHLFSHFYNFLTATDIFCAAIGNPSSRDPLFPKRLWRWMSHNLFKNPFPQTYVPNNIICNLMIYLPLFIISRPTHFNSLSLRSLGSNSLYHEKVGTIQSKCRKYQTMNTNCIW